MISTNNIKEAPQRRIWYLVETPRDWPRSYNIMCEYSMRHDLLSCQRVINKEPLTMAEAKAFKKLLTGVQS